VSIPVAIGVVLVAVALAVGAMLLVRRIAPAGGIYGAARGIGIYSAIQGSLGVLIAFVIFLAFQNYIGARNAAQDEATAVLQQFRKADLFPQSVRDHARNELICYGRAVAGPEWRAMKDGRSSPTVDAVIVRLQAVFAPAERSGVINSTAASAWLSDADKRTDGRQRRLAAATPFVPPLLWVMLAAGALVILVFLMGFADRSERAFGQAMIAAAPAAIIASGLVLIYFFDHPYSGTSGSIQPTAMKRTIDRAQLIAQIQHEVLVPPCTASGQPVPRF
jgi:hypothetical protein